MKKDINPSVIKDVAVAVVKEQNELAQDEWNVYLINLQDRDLEQVLVSSKGYLKLESGEETKTTLLRHGLGNVKAQSFVKIEPIMENLFGIHNEYWVSFFQDNELLDKKYIFLAETIKEENFTNIPLIKKKGILIK
ncbi:MAG: hypothetical protein KDD29_01820 [Flavobacteriales bacterium]|nr:hypothetical protein [Flavobacteriales bacterium]MCB9335626.1 hypothetical protein [Flavobacteriales bacterium]